MLNCPDKDGLDLQIFLEKLIDSAVLITNVVHKTTVSRKADILPNLTKIFKDAVSQGALLGLSVFFCSNV